VRLGGNRCRCEGCGERFNSETAFNRHRAGTHGTAAQPGARRCLTTTELRSRGWLKNGTGYWITGKRPAHAVTSRLETAITPSPVQG
jgi:hypothetical protein